MAANTYIARSDLRAHLDKLELAQVSVPHGVLAKELADLIDVEMTSPGTPTTNAQVLSAIAVIDAAIVAANSKIDGYLCGVYTLPLDQLPDILVLHGVAIARYHLHDVKATEEVRLRHTEAISYLTKVAEGRIKLKTAADLAAGGGNDVPTFDGPARGFQLTDLTSAANTQLCDYMGDL